MRKPDFLIGGAPRSGTTWLYHLLDQHPKIYMSKPLKPEPKFFLVDELYAKGLEFYCRTCFAGAAPEQICGEKTTNYLESAVAVARIHHDLPLVKLVFILREPADRAFSNYLWSRMNGLEIEDFVVALALEKQRQQELPEHQKYARPHDYFSRGLYAQLLRPYFARFPREQILCLRFEDILTQPESLAARLQRFLGVPPRPADVRGLGVINPSDKDGHILSEDIKKMLWELYAEPNRQLAELLGPEFEIWDYDER
ncbi:MAG: sulfotransferase family protein [Desulfobaccales bacterium]